MSLTNINYPEVTTYFIVNEKDYGVVKPTQCLSTIANIETFSDKNAFLARLEELAIDVSEEFLNG